MSIFNKLFTKEKTFEVKTQDDSKVILKQLFLNYRNLESNEISYVYVRSIINPKLKKYGVEDITYLSDYICNALDTIYSHVENDRLKFKEIKRFSPTGYELANIYLNRIFWFDKMLYKQYESGSINFSVYMMIMKIIFDTVDDCKFTDQIAAELHDAFAMYNQAKIERSRGAEPYLLQK